MSIEQKKFKRLRKELQFLQSELEYVNEVLHEWHQEFEEYQRAYCEKKNIDLAKLNEKNRKKVNQIIPQPVKKRLVWLDMITLYKKTVLRNYTNR